MEYFLVFLFGSIAGYVGTKVVERLRNDRLRKKEHEAWTRQMERLRARKEEKK